MYKRQEEDRWGEAGADPEEALERQEARERVQRLLASLPPTDRAAVVLRYWHDLPYGEIGRILGMQAASVRSRVHRARRRMARLLEEEVDGV